MATRQVALDWHTLKGFYEGSAEDDDYCSKGLLKWQTYGIDFKYI
jgi:hypothetical protein